MKQPISVSPARRSPARSTCIAASIILILAPSPVLRAALIDDIKSVVDTVSIHVADTQSRVRNVQTTVGDVQGRVSELNTQTDEMVTQVRAGLEALTDDIRSTLAEAVKDVQQAVADQRAGRDEFLASGAEPFRKELLDFGTISSRC